ncbi:MAG TPA: hypothetical protein VK887_15090 [Pseudonocardiaceae bacterium]|nr:hypothetical protein [Pseudonocardiaceae bacterium]
MTGLAPNEWLSGSLQAQHDLVGRLAVLRASPDLDRHHSELSFATLSGVLRRSPPLVDPDVFSAGWDILARRYTMLGLRRLLPMERVWVGTSSSQATGFGGFHYPNQGYRHLQMAAVITLYGDLTGNWTRSPQISALDLLRSYAHDCLHFGTYRRYRLWNTSTGDEIGRVQYGINFRKNDGRTYSAPDRASDRSTRNLGIVMEGATDREARMVARHAAQREGVPHPDTLGTDYFAFRDETGLLDGTDLSALEDPLQRTALADQPDAEKFLTNMTDYARGVGTRYDSFLREIGREEAGDLHQLVLTSMISGSLAQLSDWLNQRHGPAAFVTIFKSPAYCGRYRGEGPKRSTACATASFNVYPAESGSRTPVVIAGETV